MSLPYAYTPYIWPMLASAIIMAGLAAYAWKHRTVPIGFHELAVLAGSGLAIRLYSTQVVFASVMELLHACRFPLAIDPVRVLLVGKPPFLQPSEITKNHPHSCFANACA